MPYASVAQQAYFHANKEKMEKQGVNVDEWDAESKGKPLQPKVPARKSLGKMLSR